MPFFRSVINFVANTFTVSEKAIFPSYSLRFQMLRCPFLVLWLIGAVNCQIISSSQGKIDIAINGSLVADSMDILATLSHLQWDLREQFQENAAISSKLSDTISTISMIRQAMDALRVRNQATAEANQVRRIYVII